MFDIEEYAKNLFKDEKRALEAIIGCWKKVFDQMSVHTRKRKPEEILLKMRPNEEAQIHAYRLENYRAITYGSMNRALDSASRILKEINYSLEIDEITKEYIKQKEFYKDTFAKFMEKVVFKRDIEDPNGFLIWIPTGPGIKDSSTKVKPKPVLIYSYDIFDYTDEAFTYLSDENSILPDGNLGKVYYILTKNEFYKLVQIQNATDNKYRLDLIYKHNIGEIPVIVLGGDMNAAGYNESYFSPYVEFGDEALSVFSDWQAGMVTTVFPHKEEFHHSCEVRKVNRKSSNPDKDEEKYETQLEIKPLGRSPYGTIIREIPGEAGSLNDQILPVEIPSIRFISPPVDVVRYSGESWEKLITKAEDALHLNLANGTNQSGVAKERDLEQERAMIDKIAGNFFGNIMYNSLRYIQAYLLVKKIDNVSVAINTPATFVIKTEEELVGELALLKEKNAPALFLSQATLDLARRRFSGNPIAQKIFKVISLADPLYIYDPSQKTSFVLQGAISKEAYTKSIYIYSILLNIIEEKTESGFMKMSYEDILKEFERLIEPYLQTDSQLTNPDGSPVTVGGGA